MHDFDFLVLQCHRKAGKIAHSVEMSKIVKQLETIRYVIIAGDFTATALLSFNVGLWPSQWNLRRALQRIGLPFGRSDVRRFANRFWRK